MRLFLSETFFEKMILLPRSIQQKVLTFQQKFRANAASLAIHLEPIFKYKDNALRSARIDDGYRAIIGVLGDDNYTLLYVDQHDEAYRWAKTKKFVWNEHMQSCQLVPMIEEDAPEQYTPATQPVATEPVHANDVMAKIPSEKLLKIGVPEELLEKVHGIKDLNDLDVLSGVLPEDAYENIFYVLDNEPIDSVIAGIEEGLAKEGDDALLSNNNRRRFIEISDDDTLEQIISEGMDKWQLFLHPSQRKLVDCSYKGTLKVSGSAGTGKTIAALHRLKYLCSDANAKVLFTTYTRALRENLSRLVDKMGVQRNRYVLGNIDEILNNLARDYSILPKGYEVMDYKGGDEKSISLFEEILENDVSEFDATFLYAEYIDVIVYNNIKEESAYLRQSRAGRTRSLSRKQRMEIWRLVEKYVERKKEEKKVDRLELFNLAANYFNEKETRPFTNVIVDEFQDFSNPELRFLRSLVAEGQNDLFLVGDPFQRIYKGRKMNFAAAGINVRGNRSRKLKVNYRTTEEIKKVAVSVVSGQKYDDMDGGEENNNGYISLMHGARPVYKFVDDAQKEVDAVMDFIQDCLDSGMKSNEICVAARSANMTKPIKDALHHKGISYAEKNINSDGVAICTMHSIKGLEFRAVAVMGVNERNMPSEESADPKFQSMDSVEKKEYLMNVRSLLYVAITRARDVVLITGYGQRCKLLSSIW